MTTQTQRVYTAILVGCFLSLAALCLMMTAQRNTADRHVDTLRGQVNSQGHILDTIATKCAINVDGSAVCPPNTMRKLWTP